MAITITSNWTTEVPSTRQDLVARVTELYGVTGQTELETRALEFLDDTVRDMNSHLYEFNKIVELGITMVDGDDHVDLSTDFFKESVAYVRKSDNSKFNDLLTYMPWAHFRKMMNADRKRQGIPEYYSLFNVHNTGQLFLHPTPNATTATDYVVDVEYYRRVPLISSVGAGVSIDVPQEIQTALIYGAQKRMAIHVQGAGHDDVAPLAALEKEALGRLKSIDRRHPDEQMRFRLIDHVGRTLGQRGTLYIEI